MSVWNGPRRRLVARTAAAGLFGAAAGWVTYVNAQGQASGPVGIPAYRQANTVAILTVEGPIDNVTLRSLERRVRRANDEGVEAIVFDINTPGGEVLATRDITHLIRTECPANTVAWINPNAYSAGTIIALACREVVVAPDAAMGDSAPINPLIPLPAAERAKQEAPILAEVVHSARRNHYDENLVRAFVSVGVELWMIEEIATGQRVFVDREEYRQVFGEDPPAQITPVAPPASLQQGAPQVKPWFEKLAPLDEGGPPPDPDELARQIELEQDLPPARSRLSAADRGNWRLVKQVVPNDQLLVLKPQDAMEYGVAVKVIANDEQLKTYFGAQTIVRLDRTWSESLVRGLTHPVAMGILIVVFLVCLFIELASPGMGVFGATAGLSLLVLVGAPWLAGMAQWWEIALIIAGLVLVALELFVIPGIGVAGLAGVLCLLIGLVGTFVSGDIRTPAGQSELVTGLTATLTAFFAAGVAFWLVFRQLENLPFLGRFVLKTELRDPEEPLATGALAAMGGPDRALAPGDVGVAETDLRPAGRATFDGRPVDVKSVGAYIEQGATVRVTSVGRFVIEVEDAT
ncbi:MAG: NfeD family protein [Planctomycetota bacterium]